MNILHINTLDNEGGAARAMYRLHQGLLRLGHRSHLLVSAQTVHEPNIDVIHLQSEPFHTLTDTVMDTIGLALETRFGLNALAYRNSWHIPQLPVFRQADVVNLHNLHGGYFNLHAQPALASRKPVVWTLHDMWALTGHCAYSYNCTRWRTGCYDCPLLKEPGRQIVEPPPTSMDRTRSVWEAKRRVYQTTSLHIVAPSKWLYGLVQESILAAAASLQCIPYGVDVDMFHPVDQMAARQALDLPADKHVIFFSAAGAIDGRRLNGRKGFAYLVRALEQLPDAGSICLLTSGGWAELGEHAERFDVRQLGYLSGEEDQRLAFAAADLFVLPTLADNLPLVLIEALACGTPIVAFNVGGVLELVLHLETGYLARHKDADDLAQGIRLLINGDTLRAHMRQRCREIAEAEYSLELQSQRYLDLYRRAIQHDA